MCLYYLINAITFFFLPITQDTCTTSLLRVSFVTPKILVFHITFFIVSHFQYSLQGFIQCQILQSFHVSINFLGGAPHDLVNKSSPYIIFIAIIVQAIRNKKVNRKQINQKDLLSKIELQDNIEVTMNLNDPLQYAIHHHK